MPSPRDQLFLHLGVSTIQTEGVRRLSPLRAPCHSGCVVLLAGESSSVLDDVALVGDVDVHSAKPSSACLQRAHHADPEQQVAGCDTGRGSLAWQHRLRLSRA